MGAYLFGERQCEGCGKRRRGLRRCGNCSGTVFELRHARKSERNTRLHRAVGCDTRAFAACFYEFRGGKCVAVALGGLLVLSPVQLLIAVGCAVILIAITKMVSVGSVVGTIIATALVIYRNRGNIPLMLIAVVIAAVVITAHLPNIRRIMEGRERRLEKIEWEKQRTEKEETCGSRQNDQNSANES